VEDGGRPLEEGAGVSVAITDTIEERGTSVEDGGGLLKDDVGASVAGNTVD
jgi:hypothetical protein